MNDPRIRVANDRDIRTDGDYVLYWMTAARRLSHNYALDRAIALAGELACGVVVLEALRCGYQYASRRLQAFVIDGMREHVQALKDGPIAYYPYLEPEIGHGKGLLEALAKRAKVVVTDDFPAFMLPRMTAAAAKKLDVKLEQVDSNGLLPMRLTDKTYLRAYDFRRYVQKTLPSWLDQGPNPSPLEGLEIAPVKKLPEDVVKRWPLASLSEQEFLELPLDTEVGVVDSVPGGTGPAMEALAGLDLNSYGDRNHPDAHAESGLSPYLHFGHIGPWAVFNEIVERESWTPERLAAKATGSREGWWGMSEGAEAFMDQLCTWREVGLNRCATMPSNYSDYESLPDWAQETMAEHAADERPYVYDLETWERAETHDEVWNAAQTQLRSEGKMHNYMRMLWGKKILHWSETPREALRIMLHLNDRWAIDGRDPNSVTGILWVLGAYDRPWGPEREVFGKIRYMTVDSAKRKLRLRNYLARWSSQPSLF